MGRPKGARLIPREIRKDPQWRLLPFCVGFRVSAVAIIYALPMQLPMINLMLCLFVLLVMMLTWQEG